MRITILIACLVVALGPNTGAQQPAHDHGGHDCPMMQRGDQAMGFSHETTVHHFRLFREGGEIEVQANDVTDVASARLIPAHLAHIAKLFSAGDFNVPMFIHDTTPPGVTTMAQRKDQIRYVFFETEGANHDERSASYRRGSRFPSLPDSRPSHRRLSEDSQPVGKSHQQH